MRSGGSFLAHFFNALMRRNSTRYSKCREGGPGVLPHGVGLKGLLTLAVADVCQCWRTWLVPRNRGSVPQTFFYREDLRLLGQVHWSCFSLASLA